MVGRRSGNIGVAASPPAASISAVIAVACLKTVRDTTPSLLVPLKESLSTELLPTAFVGEARCAASSLGASAEESWSTELLPTASSFFSLVLVPPRDVTGKSVGGNRTSLNQDTRSGASGLMAPVAEPALVLRVALVLALVRLRSAAD